MNTPGCSQELTPERAARWVVDESDCWISSASSPSSPAWCSSLAGTVGLLRFPDAYTRLHALTKADNLGVALVVIGLLPQVGSVLAALKLLLIWLLVLLSSAAVSQLIARSVRRQERGE